MRWLVFGVLFAMVAAFAMAPVAAQGLCDVTYTAQAGDTPGRVARLHYADPARWTWITAANPEMPGRADAELAQGTPVFVPCAAPDGVAQSPAPSAGRGITVLATAGLAPLSSRTWPEQGLLNHLLAAALQDGPAPLPHRVAWHEGPDGSAAKLLGEGSFDLALLWSDGACDDAGASSACGTLHFSDPLIEVPLLLFVAAQSGQNHQAQSDLATARVCRPQEGMPAARSAEEWRIEDLAGRIEVAQTAEACFQMLIAGQVDAVALDALRGPSTLAAMGLNRRVVALEQPVAQLALRVAAPKVHWRGTTMIYRVNAGLEALRAGGRYDRIVNRHMTLLWDRLN